MNNENKWLDDNNLKTIDQYLNTADVTLIERNRFIKILIDLFSYNFNEKNNLHLLDLGCGDGIITKKIGVPYQTMIKSVLDRYTSHYQE